LQLLLQIETDADTWTSATKLYGLQLAEPPSLSNLYRFFYGITDNKPQAEKIHVCTELSTRLDKREKPILLPLTVSIV
jgi:hypothetical protein